MRPGFDSESAVGFTVAQDHPAFPCNGHTPVVGTMSPMQVHRNLDVYRLDKRFSEQVAQRFLEGFRGHHNDSSGPAVKNSLSVFTQYGFCGLQQRHRIPRPYGIHLDTVYRIARTKDFGVKKTTNQEK